MPEEKLSVREIQQEDIELIINYWLNADIGKKETEVQVDVENGKSYYVSCSMKTSITRARLEMQEVVEKTGIKDITKLRISK